MRRFIRIAPALLVLGLCLCWLFGSLMVRPDHHVAGPMGPGAERVAFPAGDGSAIVGTYYAATQDKAPAILMLHGNGASRQQFAKLAPWFRDQGYAVLATDFRGSGESAQVSKSFGLAESRDAHAAFAWLKTRQKGAKVGIIGTSLGGAASLMGDAGPVPADAIVLHAVYPDIRHAIHNRIAARTGGLVATLAEPLLSYQSRLRFGVWPSDISPRDALRRYQGPVFVIGGGADTSTPPAETQSMADAVPHLDRVWIVPGLTHAQLTGGDSAAYQQALLGFFDRHLKAE